MADHQIMQFNVGPVMTNCYIISNNDSHQCLVIDPGAAGEALYSKTKEEGLDPVAILATHGHFDHMGGVSDFVAAARADGKDISVYIHKAEKDTLSNPNYNQSVMLGRYDSYHADIFLDDDQILDLAGFKIKVLFTPGHTPGGCCFYFMNEGLVFCGDTLFNCSVGRTDFPGGSMSVLSRSIKDKLFTLPDDTEVFPGHDSPTTIGFEKENNPFIQ